MTTSSADTPRHRDSAREYYGRYLQRASDEIFRLQSQHVRLVWLRTALFLIALVCLVAGYGGESYQGLFLTVGWISAAAFFVAIVRHEHVRLDQLRHQSDQQLFLRLIARLDRNWSQLPDQPLLREYSALTFADDLDVAGNASLLGLVSLAGTRLGKQTLQSWIAQTPTWQEVESRQAAVKALRDHRDLRLTIVRTISASSDGSEDVYGLPDWGTSPDWLPEHRVAHTLSYVGPGLVIAGLACLAMAAGSGHPIWLNAAVAGLGAGFLVNVLITVFWGSWIHDIFQQVTGKHRAVYQFADVFESFAELPKDQGLLDSIRHVATESPSCARVGFAKLIWVVRLANLQRDPTLYFVYLALQLLFMWDIRILERLEKWKRQFGSHVTAWFEGLGACEALVSGSTLADEYPHWAFPQPQLDKAIRLEAEQLGHPLLPDSARIANDVTLTAGRPLLLVTGSNMAGKSTFMRAVGLNLLLARTGSPVCANRLSTPLYDLATSIRVRDSLRDGVSFFMAELHRLKEVVDLAQAHADNLDHPILFLLDEVLQGTNSQERQIAVASVLEKLLKVGAVGLVSTHDLDLAAAESIQTVSQIVHFREYFETHGSEEVMKFDYQMRDGPTPTTNALKLLKLVGLDADS